MEAQTHQEEFITQKPKSAFLQQYISYYYFHYSLDDSLIKRYIYYPHTKSALTIYKNSKAFYSPNHSKTAPDEHTSYSFLYSGIQKQLRTAEIIAPFHKIGIVFNELGLNHFVKEPMASISNDPIDKSFTYFGEELTMACDLIYTINAIDEKVGHLDRFFERMFYGFHDQKFKHCIYLIVNSKERLTVAEVSQKTGINPKTLLRLFKKHIGCTTKDYINIVQFRKSLNNFLLNNTSVSLTELAINNEYYDQSQFISHFKKLSGTSPKKFFNSIQHLSTEDIFWTIQ